METEQLSTELPLGKERNKEIKDFPEFYANESTSYLNLQDTVKAKVHSTMCPHKEFREILHY